MKPTVMVDIDDTIADTQHALVAYLQAHGHTDYTYDGITRAMREGSRSEYNKLAREFLLHPGTLSHLQPLPGCIPALRRLTGAGYRVHVATSRTEEMHSATLAWLEHHGITTIVDQVHIRTTTSTRNGFKADTALAIKAVCAFDDTYDAVVALTNANVPTYLLTRPWNAHEVLPVGAQRAESFPAAVTDFLRRVASPSVKN